PERAKCKIGRNLHPVDDCEKDRTRADEHQMRELARGYPHLERRPARVRDLAGKARGYAEEAADPAGRTRRGNDPPAALDPQTVDSESERDRTERGHQPGLIDLIGEIPSGSDPARCTGEHPRDDPAIPC